MPSLTLSTFSMGAIPKASYSFLYILPCLVGVPWQTTSIVLPPESWSSVAHWYASSIGCLRGKLAKQEVPSFTLSVAPATAESTAIESRRGLARMLSPAQTA